MAEPSAGNISEFRSRVLVLDHAVIWVAAVVLMLPSLIHGTPEGHSYWYNIPWADQVSRQMADGEPYPRWIDGLWAGAGGADFFFYAPLPFWVIGAIRFVFCPDCGGDRLIVISGVLWLALSGLGLRSLARRFTARWPAVVGAVIYMALPYHMGIDWGDRQALAEFVAAALIPWHLAAFLDCARGERAGPRLAGLSALVLLCHLPAALVLAVGCAALLPFVARGPGWLGLARIAGAAVLGLGLAAIYWVPAIMEMESTRTAQMTQGYYLWTKWILSPGTLLTNTAFMLGLWLGFVILSLACAMALVRMRRRNPPLAIFGLILLAVVWVMVTPLSAPIWNNTPVVRIQFPWRFLLLSDVGFGLAAALAAEAMLARAARRTGRYAAATVLMAIAAVSLSELPGMRPLRGAIPVPAEMLALKIMVPDWLPAESGKTFHARNFVELAALVAEHKDMPEALAGPEGRVSLVSRTPRRRVYAADFTAPGRVVFRTTYWRYWRLTDQATGAQIPLSATSRFPLTEAVLPAGKATYVMDLPVRTPERIGAWASGAALLLLAGWSALSWRRRRS